MIGFSELELVAAAKAGDRDAFERIVLDNERALYHLALTASSWLLPLVTGVADRITS